MLPAYSDARLKRRAFLVLFGACVTVFFTSFELRDPVISVASVSFTTSELAAGFFFLTVLLWALVDGSWFLRPRVMDLAVLLFVLSNFLSVTAAVDKPGAFKFSLRMTYAALVYLGISRLPAKARSHLVVAGAVSGTLFVVLVVGLLESYTDFDWPRLLSPWHEGIITFGAFYNVRTSSTLPFPTTLAMYLEMMLPLALVFGLWLYQRRIVESGTRFDFKITDYVFNVRLTTLPSKTRKRLLYAAIILGTAAAMAVQVYTFTRTALVTVPVSFMTGAVLAWLSGYTRRVVIMFVIAAFMLAAVLGASILFSNKVASRLGLEEPTKRFGAEYTVIDMPASMRISGRENVKVKVKNTSDVSWVPQGSGSVVFSAQWLTYPDAEIVDIPYVISRLPRTMEPGEEAIIDVGFNTPDDPGQYILVMEFFQGGVGWFHFADVPPVTYAIEFDEEGSRPFATEPRDKFVENAPVLVSPSRSQLWKAAYEAWKDNPVLGLGPDQFRKRYGEYLTDVQADERVLTNNIFLEALVNTGVPGLLVMIFLLVSAGWYQLKLIRDRALGPGARLVALGLAVALVAYVVHGLLDCFLSQTGIAFIFFTELGLTSWLYHKKVTEQRRL